MLIIVSDLGAVPVLFSFSILIEGKLPVPNLKMALVCESYI